MPWDSPHLYSTRETYEARHREGRDRRVLVPLAVISWLVPAVAVLLLSGCTTTTRVVETPLSERIPTSLLGCRSAPVASSLDRQSDVARWVVDLDTAGQDCRSKLAAIRQIVDADTNHREAP